MAQTMQTAWNTKRHWSAAGFLASASLFSLLLFVSWRDARRGIAAQEATGLSATAWEPASMWQQQNTLPSSLARQRARTGGASPADHIDPQVVRTGTLEIIATDPLQAAERLRNVATQLSGFTASFKVSAGEEGTTSAQIIMRIPAEHFDEARTKVQTIAKTVEQDTVDARDVTREDVNQEANLRNSRAEETQYLAILKRATAVKDVLEVSSKLAEVRGRIAEREADLRFLHQQVQMSLLTTNITGVAEAQVLGIRWRPLYQAKLSLRGALSALGDYASSMVALFLNLPVIAMWGFTIVALLKAGWGIATAYRAAVLSRTNHLVASSREV